MSPLIAPDYEKLTNWQKSQFHELVAKLKGKDNQGLSASDLGHFKIIEWVKRMDEPPPAPILPDPEETPKE